MNALAAAIRGQSSLSCVSVDAFAWERELAAVLGDDEVMASLEARHGLLAQNAVLVPDDGLVQMKQAVAVMDSVLRERAPAAARPGVLGFDFHLTANGPKLIEINTNPGGLLLVLAQQRVWRRLRPDLTPAGLEAGQAENLALLAFAGQARRVAIVDDAPSGQFLYPEFLLYRQGFIRRGLETAIIDASRWSGGFDGVYNRLTDFALSRPEHAALALDHAAGRTVLIPDPASHGAFADKRRLIGLSQHPQCGVWVPPIFPGSEDWEAAWRSRHHLFFKPALGFGGKGGYRGDKISRATWEKLDPATTLAQALVPPPVLDNGFKVDIRGFAVDGEVLAFGARLYRGQMTNFRSVGGGLAAVFCRHAG